MPGSGRPAFCWPGGSGASWREERAGNPAQIREPKEPRPERLRPTDRPLRVVGLDLETAQAIRLPLDWPDFHSHRRGPLHAKLAGRQAGVAGRMLKLERSASSFAPQAASAGPSLESPGGPRSGRLRSGRLRQAPAQGRIRRSTPSCCALRAACGARPVEPLHCADQPARTDGSSPQPAPLPAQTAAETWPPCAKATRWPAAPAESSRAPATYPPRAPRTRAGRQPECKSCATS